MEILKEERNEIKEERSKNLTFYFPNACVRFNLHSKCHYTIKRGECQGNSYFRFP